MITNNSQSYPPPKKKKLMEHTDTENGPVGSQAYPAIPGTRRRTKLGIRLACRMPADVANAAAGFRLLVKVYARRLPWYTLPAGGRAREPDMKKTFDALAADVCAVAVA